MSESMARAWDRQRRDVVARRGRMARGAPAPLATLDTEQLMQSAEWQ